MNEQQRVRIWEEIARRMNESESLVRRVLNKFRRRGLRLPDDDVDEIEQEVWLRVFQAAVARGGLDHVNRFRPWVARITRRTFFKACRRRDRHYLAEWAVDVADPRDSLDGVEVEEAWATFKATAPPEVGDAFVLVRRRGLSVAEAAARLGVGPKTVQRRLAKARAILWRLFGLEAPERDLAAGRPARG